MDTNDKTVIIVENGKIRIPTEEELAAVEKSGVLCSLYQSNISLLLEEELRVLEESLKLCHDDEPLFTDNHSWKKSNRHRHPAFKRR